MKQKIMAVVARREGNKPPSGRVEIDDAHDKRGQSMPPARRRLWPPSRPTSRARLLKARLVPVKGFHKHETARGAKRWLPPDSRIVTDDLACWTALDHAGHDHRQPALDPTARQPAWYSSSQSTPHSETSKAQSSGPTASSDPTTPNTTSPALLGSTTHK